MTLVEVEDLTVSFPPGNHSRKNLALDGVDLTIERGETLAVVGESGSGKTTLVKSLVRLVDWERGSIRFDGIELGELGDRGIATVRSRMGLVMQDPTSALNPRRSVISSVGSPLESQPWVTRAERRSKAAEALERVGLPLLLADRRPKQLSGGQRQRVNLARALVGRPELLLCDEAMAGLDLVTEASIVDLFRTSIGDAACLFITHDLVLAATLGDRIAVLQRGKLVEQGPTAEVLSRPGHPHTRELIESIPPADPDGDWRDRLGIDRDQPPFEAGA